MLRTIPEKKPLVWGVVEFIKSHLSGGGGIHKNPLVWGWWNS